MALTPTLQVRKFLFRPNKKAHTSLRKPGLVCLVGRGDLNPALQGAPLLGRCFSTSPGVTSSVTSARRYPVAGWCCALRVWGWGNSLGCLIHVPHRPYSRAPATENIFPGRAVPGRRVLPGELPEARTRGGRDLAKIFPGKTVAGLTSRPPFSQSWHVESQLWRQWPQLGLDPIKKRVRCLCAFRSHVPKRALNIPAKGYLLLQGARRSRAAVASPAKHCDSLARLAVSLQRDLVHQ